MSYCHQLEVRDCVNEIQLLVSINLSKLRANMYFLSVLYILPAEN